MMDITTKSTRKYSIHGKPTGYRSGLFAHFFAEVKELDESMCGVGKTLSEIYYTHGALFTDRELEPMMMEYIDALVCLLRAFEEAKLPRFVDEEEAFVHFLRSRFGEFSPRIVLIESLFMGDRHIDSKYSETSIQGVIDVMRRFNCLVLQTQAMGEYYPAVFSECATAYFPVGVFKMWNDKITSRGHRYIPVAVIIAVERLFWKYVENCHTEEQEID